MYVCMYVCIYIYIYIYINKGRFAEGIEKGFIWGLGLLAASSGATPGRSKGGKARSGA